MIREFELAHPQNCSNPTRFGLFPRFLHLEGCLGWFRTLDLSDEKALQPNSFLASATAA
ncbi:hypothetical protein [Parasulfuritortus cantonensis]|uniref:hypothetical protein n=1 Tax=Parasulfuritortus cantonensis TaxID=2528202 RepID=UPI001404D7B9|nr:hypothetical protein [Parasulfuritortus cantonensis]